MAAKKEKAVVGKIEVLTRLDMEQCVDSLKQFDEAYPTMRARKEFLGISVAMEAGTMMLKITVTQLGEAKFTEEMALPKEFDVSFPLAKANLKVLIKSAPILTSAAPKSAAGKKTAPVFPTATR